MRRQLGFCTSAPGLGLARVRESQREDSASLLSPHAGSCVPSCPIPCWRASASSTLRASSLGRSRGSAEVSEAPARIGSGPVLCSFWYVPLLPAYEIDPQSLLYLDELALLHVLCGTILGRGQRTVRASLRRQLASVFSSVKGDINIWLTSLGLFILQEARLWARPWFASEVPIVPGLGSLLSAGRANACREL